MCIRDSSRKEPGAEPDERGNGIERKSLAVPGHTGQQPLDQFERIAGRAGMGWKKGVEDFARIGTTAGHGLQHLGQADEQQNDEWHGGEQRIKRDATRQEGNAAFVRCLQHPPHEAEWRAIPVALLASAQAVGSSGSTGEASRRRRARASDSRRSISSRADGSGTRAGGGGVASAGSSSKSSSS